jgi:hypothetical protein
MQAAAKMAPNSAKSRGLGTSTLKIIFVTLDEMCVNQAFFKGSMACKFFKETNIGWQTSNLLIHLARQDTDVKRQHQDSGLPNAQ